MDYAIRTKRQQIRMSHSRKRRKAVAGIVVMTTVNSSFVQVAQEQHETEGFTLNANERV